MSTLNLKKPVFGAVNGEAAPAKEYKKAQFWLNIGYEVDVPADDGSVESRFINLPMGLALDTMEEVPTNSSNQVFAAMQIAKNDLLKQLIAAGAEMAPGESKIVNLQIQLRRVNDGAGNAQLADPNVNPFLKKITL